MRSHLNVAAGSALGVGVLLGLGARDASAGANLGLDLDLGAALQEHVYAAYGIGGRIGYKAHFADTPLWVLPEIGARYMSFGSATEFRQASAVFGGLRVGAGHLLQPVAFMHGGLGWTHDIELRPYLDVGLGLEVQPIKIFAIGIQAAYNSVWDDTSRYSPANWFSFGLTFGLELGR
jgi:small basic protein